MTQPSPSAAGGPLQALADDELLKRVGDIAYALQMSAAEGLSLDDETRREAEALQRELARRGLKG